MARVALIIAGAGSAAGLLLLAWLGTYSRLLADDFCTAARVQRLGVGGFLISQYTGWSGRFSFHFLAAALAGTGTVGIRLLPAITLAALVTAVGFAVRRLSDASVAGAATLGLVFTWALTGQTLDPFQTLFWAAGSLTYTLPIALVALWAGCALRPTGPHWSVHLLLFGASGFSETGSAILLATLSVSALVWRDRRPALLGGLLAAFTGTLAMAAAPGNWVRSAHFASRREMAQADGGLLADLVRGFHVLARNEWSAAWPGFLLALAAAFCAGTLAPEARDDRRPIGRWILAGLVVMGSALAAPVLLGRLVLGGAVPPRAVLPSHAVLVGLFLLAGWLLGRTTRLRGASVGAAALILMMLPLGLAVSEHAGWAPSAAAFARSWDALDTALRNSTARSLTVQAPPTVGNLHFVNASPEFWSNRCMADYYRLERIGGSR